MKNFIIKTIIVFVFGLTTFSTAIAITAEPWVQSPFGSLRPLHYDWLVAIGTTSADAKLDIYNDPILAYSQRVRAGILGSPITGIGGNGDVSLYTVLQDTLAGVYLSSLDASGSTYGVASVDPVAVNYFMGNVGIATTTPDSRLTVSSGQTGPAEASATVGPSSSNYTNGTTVTYKICAQFSSGKYSQTCTETNQIIFTGPSTTEQGNIIWTAVPGATSYVVSRNKNSAGYANSYNTGSANTFLFDSDGGSFTWGSLIDTSAVSLELVTRLGFVSGTNAYAAHLTGSMLLTGAFFDGSSASGTPGMILQSTGTSTKWVATSTLGITGTGNAAFTLGNGFIYNATSTNNVAIGTTTPAAKFYIQGTRGSTTPVFAVASSTSVTGATSSLFMVLPNGNIGVGTGTPLTSLVVSASTTPTFTIANENGVVASNVVLGKLSFYSSDLSPNGSGEKVTLSAISNSITGVSYDAAISTSNSGPIVEAMRLTSTGNIGIGTTSPAARLSVMASTSNVTLPQFMVASSTGSSTLIVLANGNVGIGSSTPANRLLVVGAAGTQDIAVLASSSGSSLFKLKQSGQTEVGGLTPTIATSTGIGATGGTATVTGTANGGVITVNTGTLPAGSAATIVTITYPQACTTDSAVVLTAADPDAAALSASGSVYMDGNTTTATMVSGSTGLVGATTYIWNYQVICW